MLSGEGQDMAPGVSASMHRPLILIVVGAAMATLAALAGWALWYERPTKLTVAVSRSDDADRALMEAAARLLKRSHNAARLQIEAVDDPAAAAAAVDAGKADLAVIRTDIAIPADAQTVVILHRDSALLVTPASSGLKAVGDLPGHTIGVVRMGAGNRSLIATVLSEADLKPDSVTLVELKPEDVERALRAKTISAVMAVDVMSSGALRDIVRAVAAVDPPIAAVPPPKVKPSAKVKAKGAKKSDDDEDDEAKSAAVLIPIGEADAIAARSPAYEKIEVVRGTFGGTPPRPKEAYDTLSITHRLVANENVSQDLISGLTRFFLTEKGPIASTAPIAMRIEAPNTDKGAALPVHAGSAAYIDDDEQTFFDKYSDMIYIGAMLLGVLASGATAVMGRLNGARSGSLDAGVGRLAAMLALVRGAPSEGTLDDLQAEADAMLGKALETRSTVGGDDRRLAVFSLALDQVRAAVRDRRAQLTVRHGPALGIMARAAE